MLATTQQSVFFNLIQAYNVEVKTLFLSLIFKRLSVKASFTSQPLFLLHFCIRFLNIIF